MYFILYFNKLTDKYFYCIINLTYFGLIVLLKPECAYYFEVCVYEILYKKAARAYY